jgi:hypothetical protein
MLQNIETARIMEIWVLVLLLHMCSCIVLSCEIANCGNFALGNPVEKFVEKFRLKVMSSKD